LPYQPTPVQANYNPYVTVDLVSSITPSDGRIFDVGVRQALSPNFSTTPSSGRLQAYSSTLAPQTNSAVAWSAASATNAGNGGAYANAFTIASGGNGYLTAPSVRLTGADGSGAAAHAVLTRGVVTSIVLDAPGNGYTTYGVNIDPPPPINTFFFTSNVATATATINGTGGVAAVNVTAGGNNYAAAPIVTLSGGGGTGALAAATINTAGQVTSITVTSAGTGYTSAPAVTISLVNGPNSPLTSPANWLVHLDRQVTSAMELLYVSGYAPYRLTQLFQGASPPYAAAYGHMSMPAWFDTNARIYRALEFFNTPIGQDLSAKYFPATSGTSLVPATDRYGQNLLLSGRVGGLMNLNDIWDLQAFQALCDFQPALNTFSQAQVTEAFNHLMQSRAGGTPTSPVPLFRVMPNGNDRPFKGMAAASADNTFLRSWPVGQGTTNPVNADPTTRLLNGLTSGTGASGHPYVQMELMNKIYGNTTCRSNAFAVWVTVGFFDVTDGPLSITSGSSMTPVTTGNAFSFGTQTITPTAMSGSILGVPWQISPGCILWVGNGSDVESVVVTKVTATTFTANFLNSHAANETIAMKGVLGQEVNIGEGRNIRHRMFALIDRSALSVPAALSNQGTLATVTPPINVQSIVPAANWINPMPTLSLGSSPPALAGQPFTITLPTFTGYDNVVPTFLSNSVGLVPSLKVTVAAGTAPASVALTLTSANLSLAGNCAFSVTATDSTGVLPSTTQFYYIPVYCPLPVSQLSGVSNLSAPFTNLNLSTPSINVNYPWQIQPGMMLSIDGEIVTIQSVNTTTNVVTALFQNAHNQLGPVPLLLPGQTGVVPGSILGNPGPQQQFDHRLNTALVPHYSIIR
jgi:hypothetical protein